ncbi:MAG: glycoside hydrolase TIM-barrel-like domain-containing protein [Rickettsiales bacterium]|nr:glycoside hydrolase TIM-barrel-like domain-containing protein [Rickettsiales bacterium]
MTTFIFTQAINSINTAKNRAINSINTTALGQLYYGNGTKTKKDKITGKLSELSIQVSSYNKIIPMVYGTNRLAGNIIWVGDVKETYNTNTTTVKIGKGQKIKQTSIEYFYHLSFAIAICKGEIEKIENVWADTNLLDLTQYKYRFYSGTDTQEVDPLIEAIEGIGHVSAYKGLCYVVFENFPISEFNNRIPNFIFEITRTNNKNNDETSLEYCVNGINLMPANGSCILSTEVQYRAEKQFLESAVNEGVGTWTILNQNNNSKVADALCSLNQLTEDFKNCEWFVMHNAFFGDSLNIANCSLKPRVEFNVFTEQTYNYGYPIYTRPDVFAVGSKWNRYNTPILGKDENGNFRFSGGTNSDGSILSFFKELKNRNKKTVFCPEILMDIDSTPSQTLLTGTTDDVNDFFVKENGYNEFILHYAELLKDYVDVFLIGNELTGLTVLQDENGNFPAVDNLINLAEQVKDILGNDVKVSYVAGYKEYHSNNYWYNLDNLWGCDYIDFVGINAFFPLTNAPQTEITKNAIKNGWSSGEGYNYITENNIQNEISSEYAYKNIKYWWENVHINPDGVETNWIPRSKKIWFIEYGFRSIDGATNEPYKRVGELPKYSGGDSNFYAQRNAIEATNEFFKNSEYVENMFVYYWDLRPYPFFPNKTDIWADGVNWEYDYCLNGKTGISNAKVSINQLFNDADLNADLIEDIDVDEFVDGFVINNSMTVMDVIQILQKVYFFDCVENDGKISFISNRSSGLDNDDTVTIYEGELLPMDDNNYIVVNTINNSELPKRIDLIFLDKNNDYDAKSVYAERTGIVSDRREIETLPVVLDESRARNIVETLLYSTWLEKNTFNFIIPMKYVYINPADVVKLQIQNNVYTLKIINLKIEDNTIKVVATIFDNTIYHYQSTITLNNNITLVQDVGKTKFEILEIPAINHNMLESIHLFFLITNELNSWNGATLYFSNNNKKSYKFFNETKVLSTVGVVLNEPEIVKPYYFDIKNVLKVKFNNNINTDLLINVDDYELLNGANIAIYGNEIIQFKYVILNEDGTYSIYGLLRGLFNTETEINKHSIYDRFAIINDNIPTHELDYNSIDLIHDYKVVSVGDNFSNSNDCNYKITGTNLKPFKPCHVHYKIFNNYIHFEWCEKGRGYINWISGRDFVSFERVEKYYLQIFVNGTNIFSTYVYGKEYDYEFDSTQLQFPVILKLCQVNDLYGFGDAIEVNIE